MMWAREGGGVFKGIVEMIVKIISWNIRGANNKEKRKIIKAYLRSQKADVVCL